MSHFVNILHRDIKLAWRDSADLVARLMFFMVVVSLFPLGIGADLLVLKKIAAGVVWVTALLSSMMALPRLFAEDYQDGTLEQLALLPTSLVTVVSSKIIAHWLTTVVPLIVLAPLLGLQYNLGGEALMILTISLLLGSPALSTIGAIGAALTLGVKGSGVMIPLLILPLTIPVLIFGAGAVDATISGLNAAPHLSLLTAISLVATSLAPWAVAAALRLALE